MGNDYSFGDSARASTRLALLARVFEAPSRAFLREAGLAGCGLAVDLGCGPGFTTRLLADTLKCGRCVGLDASAAFVAEAVHIAPAGLEFKRHDATRVPFPSGPADLLYARLLCSHLTDPAAALQAWLGALRPGGRLLLDDVEWIRCEHAAFQRYVGLVDALLAARGHCLCVGPRLDEAARLAGWSVVSNRVREHPVAARDAATLFSLNLAELRQNGGARAHLDDDALDALAEALRVLCREGGAGITWGLRQLALEA